MDERVLQCLRQCESASESHEFSRGELFAMSCCIILTIPIFLMLFAVIYFEIREVLPVRRPKQDPNAPILQVPREIIQEIAKLLPPSDAASFSLTSGLIWNIVGPKNWMPLLHGPELSSFLERLQEHMPDHMLCYHCMKFHHKKPAKYYGTRACRKKNGGVAIIAGHERLPFTHAQQVMNRHLYGPTHTVLQDVSSSNKVEHLTHVSRRTSYELKVVGDDVILQQVVSVSFSWDDWKPRPRFPFNYRLNFCPHCVHMSFSTAELLKGVSGVCRACGTEGFQLLRQTGYQLYTYHVSVWQSLGPCRSSREAQWRSMAEHCSYTSYPWTITESAPLRHFYSMRAFAMMPPEVERRID